MSTLFKVGGVYEDCKRIGAENVFSITRKNKDGKEKIYNTGGGETVFRNFNITRGGKTAPAKILYESSGPEDYITIVQGARDPNQKIEGGQEEEKKNPKDVIIGTTISKSGVFGALMDAQDKAIGVICGKLNAKPASDPDHIKMYDIVKTPDGQNMMAVKRTCSTGVKRRYSDKQQVPENLRGKERPDPKIELHCDFGVWPQGHFLAGKRKMIVRDYTKPIRQGEKVDYAEAMVTIDGVPRSLNETNAYLFLSYNAKIRKIIVDEATFSISDKFASNRKNVLELVVEPFEGYDTMVVDDDGSEHVYNIAEESAATTVDILPVETVAVNTPVAAVAVNTPVATVAVNTPVATVAATASLDDMTINSFIAGMQG